MDEIKPRIILMRDGPARGCWRCMGGDMKTAFFGNDPAHAYYEWVRWNELIRGDRLAFGGVAATPASPTKEAP